MASAISRAALFHSGVLVDESYLSRRFCDLWQACAGTNTAQVWQKLRQHYTEPHRYYHTLGHLTHCLTQLDAAKDHIEEFNASEMALWFHDVIYHYGAKDNEILSADFFRNVARSTMPEHFIDRVCEFIIATQHAGAAKDAAIAFVVDIDLSGFGLPWEGYLADSNALRDEASSVGDAQYYQGKLRFLSELQNWSSLFQSPFFKNRLEAPAQSNIARYTDDLRRQGFGDMLFAQQSK
jgi:predicted metal-dependent HD superfamily phosphohydrolase